MSARDVPTRLYFRAKNKTTGRVYVHNLTKCAERLSFKISAKYLLIAVEHLNIYVVEIIRSTFKE